MKHKLLLTIAAILTFLILTPIITLADPEQYLTAGVSRDNTYQQDGTGVWAGRTPVTYTRSASMNSYFPVIGDVDEDGTPEIISIENNLLYVLNFTPGIGLVAEQSITHGDTILNTDRYYPTPYIFFANSSTNPYIISTNITHILAYRYQAGTIYLNKSVPTRLNISADANQGFVYPVIKCAPYSQWNTSHNLCVFPITNRSASTGFITIIWYDLDTNTLFIGNTSGLSNTDATFRSTHLYDGDGDGYLEAYFSMRDGGNGDLYVYKAEPQTRQISVLTTQNAAPGSLYTDIIVNKLDGVTPMITWGYTTDLTNFDAYTVNANTGALVDASYCTVLTCPEGNRMSSNMFSPSDTTYADYTSDVCYYVRNTNKNDPGVNIDTVHCISRFAGAGTTETTISNTVDMNPVFVHDVDITGVTGLLLPDFVVQGGTKETNPVLIGADFCVPVDAQGNGGLDIICRNTTHTFYNDDAYTNQNVLISSIAPDTGNSICTGETLTTTISISDEENDAGNCLIRVTYANGTIYGTQNYSNTTFTGGQPTIDLFFTATTSTILNLIHTYSCRDQYHDGYTTRAYAVTYSNETCGSGKCNCKGYGAPIPIQYDPDVNVTATQIDDNFDAVMQPLFGTSPRLKMMFAVGIIIGIMVMVAYHTRNAPAILASGLLGTILVTFLGLMNVYILIITIVSLVLLLVLGKTVFSSNNGS